MLLFSGYPDFYSDTPESIVSSIQVNWLAWRFNATRKENGISLN